MKVVQRLVNAARAVDAPLVAVDGRFGDRTTEADRANPLPRQTVLQLPVRPEHHPVPTPDMYRRSRSSYALAPGRTHLAYFGSFYANRGPGLMLAALQRLTGPERDRVQLHVFTERHEQLRLEVIERGLADVVRVGGLMGYLEYLHATTRFDVLLLTDFETAPHYVPNPYLPSKYADYAGSGARTWCVVEPGSVASGLPAAFHTPVGDVAAMAAVLRTLAAEAPAPPGIVT